MMIRATHSQRSLGLRAAASPSDDLPYTVEIWNLMRTAPERVLGRALSLGLARAIFEAARREHLDRRIILRQGLSVLEQTD